MRMIKKLLNSSWRFYFFYNNDTHYCFDSFTHKIYGLNQLLYDLLKNKKYRDIKNTYFQFYKKVLKVPPFNPKEYKDDKCYVTINFSNKCNLNCKYCFRNKKEKSLLTNESLKEIVDYVKTIYFPNASQYIFSLCYTSESSLDLEKLKFFDYLIGENEGYLYSKEEIKDKKLLKILELIPKEITDKYLILNNPFKIINEILRKEKLWEIYDYSHHEYLSTLKINKNKLSGSRTIMVNRQLLNYVFPKYSPEKKIQYMSMSFMTNGTNISDEYIDFIKGRLDSNIYVSLDGPENVHNDNRVYHDGTGTYQDVIKGIEKIRKSGIDVIPSAVITPKHPDLNIIVEHFIELGFKDISFNLARGKNEVTRFTADSINQLIKSIRIIYEEILQDFRKNEISSKLIILKKSILFDYLRSIYYRKYVTNRCRWGRSLVIDSKGDIYHCDSTIGYKNDCLGNYQVKKTKTQLFRTPHVNDNFECRKCYAKYLCGGTCYAEQVFNNKQNKILECYFHKELINEALKFYVKLKSESLLENFMKILI